MLADMTGHQLLLRLDCSLELRQLFLLLRRLRSAPLHYVLAPHSIILPKSAVTAECAANFIMDNLLESYEVRVVRLESLLCRLIGHDQFHALARLLQTVPDCIYDACLWEDCDFVRLACELAKADLLGALVFFNRLRRSTHKAHCQQTLCGIMAAPVRGGEFMDAAKALDLLSPEFAIAALSAISESCALPFETHQADRATFHERNVALIESLDAIVAHDMQAPRLLASYARLLNRIRFGPVLDAVFFDEQVLPLLVTNHLKHPSHNLSLDKKMLAAAVYSRQYVMISSVLKWIGSDHVAAKLRVDLRQHSEFARPFIAIQHLNQRNHRALTLKTVQLVVLNGPTPSIERVREVECGTARLLIAAACSLDMFAMMAKETAAKGELLKLVTVIPTVIDELENPVPFVNAILPYLEHEGYTCSLSSQLRRSKYLCPLLLDTKNATVSLETLFSFDIDLEMDFVRRLLCDDQLAAAFGSERCRPLRERISTPFTTFFVNFSPTSQQILRLFELFQNPIQDTSFSSPIVMDRVHDYCAMFASCALNRVATHASEPGFLSYMALCMSADDFGAGSLCSSAFRVNPTNPCLLKAFRLFDLWLQSNCDNFIEFVPYEVVATFVQSTTKRFLS